MDCGNRFLHVFKKERKKEIPSLVGTAYGILSGLSDKSRRILAELFLKQLCHISVADEPFFSALHTYVM